MWVEEHPESVLEPARRTKKNIMITPAYVYGEVHLDKF